MNVVLIVFAIRTLPRATAATSAFIKQRNTQEKRQSKRKRNRNRKRNRKRKRKRKRKILKRKTTESKDKKKATHTKFDPPRGVLSHGRPTTGAAVPATTAHCRRTADDDDDDDDDDAAVAVAAADDRQ